MKYATRFFVFFALILITACKSAMSDGEITDLSAIGAKVEVLQSLTDKNDNNVTVELFDSDGKAIGNKNIKLKVNGIVLDFKDKKELYYASTSAYSGTKISVVETYHFEIELTDGRSYTLGSVAPIGESNNVQIECPEKGNFDEDFTISWSGLKEVNELSITPGVLLKTSTAKELKYGYEPAITKVITEQGSYTLPKTSFINSEKILSSLTIQFNASKIGTVNKELLKSSSIKAFGHLGKTIDFKQH